MRYKRRVLLMSVITLLVAVFCLPVGAASSKAKLSKNKLTMYVGRSYPLKAEGFTGKVTWKSSDTKIATVSSKGKVTAQKKGTAVITAKCGKQKKTCKVMVKPIELSKKKVTTTEGKTFRLKLYCGATSGIKWKSSNKKVVKIKKNTQNWVTLEALKHGKATITATYKDKKYKCVVTVKKKPEKKLEQQPEEEKTEKQQEGNTVQKTGENTEKQQEENPAVTTEPKVTPSLNPDQESVPDIATEPIELDEPEFPKTETPILEMPTEEPTKQEGAPTGTTKQEMLPTEQSESETTSIDISKSVEIPPETSNNVDTKTSESTDPPIVVETQTPSQPVMQEPIPESTLETSQELSPETTQEPITVTPNPSPVSNTGNGNIELPEL